MEFRGDGVRVGDGPKDADGTRAPRTHRHIDVEDAGEEGHPREPTGQAVAQLTVEDGSVDRGELT